MSEQELLDILQTVAILLIGYISVSAHKKAYGKTKEAEREST